jgi:hypothetical protein
MPRKDKASYKDYTKEYVRQRRSGLIESNKPDEAIGMVEIGGFEPPTSAMRTQRSPN